MARDSSEERLREAIIGEIEPASIVVADHDPTWPERFRQEEAKIRTTLGDTALMVEHIGSTSVPGLGAKPIVDILLVVEDSGNEESYLLRVREPDWHEHRMFRTPEKDVHLHVYSSGSPEIQRYLLLRDHLRSDERDRELYARTKRDLATKDWPSVDH